MTSIEPIVKKTSAASPGVTFSVRTLNKIQRAARDFPIADQLAEFSWLAEDQREIIGDGKSEKPDLTVAEKRAAATLQYKMSLIEDRDIKPAYIRAGLISIDGLTIAGSPATVDSLLASGGPAEDALIDEIYKACDDASGLTAAQQKNSDSPTTSKGPAAGEELSSSPVEAAGEQTAPPA